MAHNNRKNLASRILIGLIRGYKYVLSPLLPPACRFYPTCSAYTVEAITKYGAIKGTGKGLWRLLRCHPFSSGGYDPV